MSSKALDNARRALAQLEAFLATPVEDDRDRAGVIQAFEFTFECVWRLLKHAGEVQGLGAASPKRALSVGYRLGLIDDESLWLEMLRDRNLTSHTYNTEIAAAILIHIRQSYRQALADAVATAAVELDT